MSATADNVAWMQRASCGEPDVDKSVFHASSESAVRKAKQVCQGCPVKESCLRYALRAGDVWGVWGGLDDRERRHLAGRVAA